MAETLVVSKANTIKNAAENAIDIFFITVYLSFIFIFFHHVIIP